MGVKSLDSCYFVSCWFKDLFKTTHNILMYFPKSFFSKHFVHIHIVHPYISIYTITARKEYRGILLERSVFYIYIKKGNLYQIQTFQINHFFDQVKFTINNFRIREEVVSWWFSSFLYHTIIIFVIIFDVAFVYIYVYIIYIYIYIIYIYIYIYHHHIVLAARISLTLSRHSSLSFIALGRSSGQQPVSSHSFYMGKNELT